jgi:2-polyprenyl-3-methyl-5-hydroxy-6-metoxy-1,4-benzoquinol methylase
MSVKIMQSELVEICSSKFNVYSRIIPEAEVASFTRREECPACGATEAAVPAVQIGAIDWTSSISVDVCGDCGHVYYDNPPPQEVMNDYYRSEWMKDQDSAKTLDDYSVKPMDKIARLFASMNISDKNVRILDVGCGAGTKLLGLKEAGYTDLSGCEMSDQRVEITSRYFPGKIYNVGYSGVPKDNKFYIIYSSHVVEHMYNPRDFFSWAAAALEDDGFIVISLPNAEKEPVFQQVLFLPHLHSFSPLSLHRLGETHGFQSTFWQGANQAEIMCVFTRNPKHFKTFNQSDFRSWQDRTGHTIEELVERTRAPWSETSGKTMTLTYISSPQYNCERTLWRSYVRLGWFSDILLRIVYFVSKHLLSIGLKTLSIRSRLMLKFITRPGAQIKSVGYVRLKNANSEHEIPRISHQDSAVLLLK